MAQGVLACDGSRLNQLADRLIEQPHALGGPGLQDRLDLERLVLADQVGDRLVDALGSGGASMSRRVTLEVSDV